MSQCWSKEVSSRGLKRCLNAKWSGTWRFFTQLTRSGSQQFKGTFNAALSGLQVGEWAQEELSMVLAVQGSIKRAGLRMVQGKDFEHGMWDPARPGRASWHFGGFTMDGFKNGLVHGLNARRARDSNELVAHALFVRWIRECTETECWFKHGNKCETIGTWRRTQWVIDDTKRTRDIKFIKKNCKKKKKEIEYFIIPPGHHRSPHLHHLPPCLIEASHRLQSITPHLLFHF